MHCETRLSQYSRSVQLFMASWPRRGPSMAAGQRHREVRGGHHGAALWPPRPFLALGPLAGRSQLCLSSLWCQVWANLLSKSVRVSCAHPGSEVAPCSALRFWGSLHLHKHWGLSQSLQAVLKIPETRLCASFLTSLLGVLVS